MKRTFQIFQAVAVVLACSMAPGIACAQEAKAPSAPPPGPSPAMQLAMRVISPEVLPDHRIVFRILAPQAKTVGLRGGDIQGLPREGPAFTKDEDGVWSATVTPTEPAMPLSWTASPPWTREIPP
jgi:hypothetical protein